MGFLGVNRRKPPKRKSPNHHHAKQSKRINIEPPKPVVIPKKQEPLSFVDLPREILEIIFVQSGNLALPSASLRVARNLSRSSFLERQLVSEHMTDDRELPCELVAHWPFVSAQLLRDLNIEKFCGQHKYVPGDVEQGEKTPEKVALLAYMVERGCEVEDPEETYMTLLNGGYHSTIARSLVRRQARCDHRAVLESLKRNQAALALSLVPLCKDLDQYGMDIYTTARETNCTPVLDTLRKILFPESDT